MYVYPLNAWGFTGASSDDGVWINWAITTYNGNVQLVPGNTYNIYTGIVISSPTNWPRGILGGGADTVLNYYGSGTCLQVFNNINPYQYTRVGSRLQDFVIDGSNATGNAIGFNITGNQGDELRFGVRNFSTGPSGGPMIAVRFANDVTALNGLNGYLRLENNDNNIVFATTTSDQSLEHFYLDISITLGDQNQNGNNQNGIYLQRNVGLGEGVVVQGCFLRCDIRSFATSGWALKMDHGCYFEESGFQWKNELTGSATTATTVVFDSSGLCGWHDCWGYMYFSPNLIQSNASAVTPLIPVVHFNGGIHEPTIWPFAQPHQEDNDYTECYDLGYLANYKPAVGASPWTYTNNTGYPIVMTLAGGTLSAAATSSFIGGTIGDINTRIFHIPRGTTLTLTYSVAPTVTIQPWA